MGEEVNLRHRPGYTLLANETPSSIIRACWIPSTDAWMRKIAYQRSLVDMMQQLLLVCVVVVVVRRRLKVVCLEMQRRVKLQRSRCERGLVGW